MLEQLFGSKTRVKLLRVFMSNPGEPYYLRELARLLKTQLNSVRREVENLEKIGIVQSVKLSEADIPEKLKEQKEKNRRGHKNFFLVNTTYVLYPELKALLLKAELLLEQNFVKKIEKLARPKLLILTGLFVDKDHSPTDILIVGNVNKHKLAVIIKSFEKEISRSINYTVMTFGEYKYRHDITDRFLYDILEGLKIIIIDKINT